MTLIRASSMRPYAPWTRVVLTLNFLFAVPIGLLSLVSLVGSLIDESAWDFTSPGGAESFWTHYVNLAALLFSSLGIFAGSWRAVIHRAKYSWSPVILGFSVLLVSSLWETVLRVRSGIPGYDYVESSGWAALFAACLIGNLLAWRSWSRP